MSINLVNNKLNDTQTIFKFIIENNKHNRNDIIKSLQYIKRHLEKLLKLNTPKLKKINMSQFITKKFILNIQGCKEILIYCGYKLQSIKSKSYLIIEDSIEKHKVNINNILKELKKYISSLKQDNEEKRNISILSFLSSGRNHVEKIKCKCGFWGNHETNNMCSTCYREHLMDIKKVNKMRWKKSIFTVIFTRYLLKSVKKKQVNKKRCFSCHKKVGYLGFQCNCGYIFCDIHRLPYKHNCEYNHKQKYINKLHLENKKVVTDKMKDRV